MTITGQKINVNDTFGQKLVMLGKSNPQLVVIEADLMRASGSDLFKNMFPERHFQVGIAEQNLIGVAAGLAAMGKIPFASTFANFASQRACDQAAIAVALNKFNVKICRDYAGLTSEKNGATHISVADISIYRSMPGMVVIVPGDCTELSCVMDAITAYNGPVYLRKARGPMVNIFPDDHKFTIGKGVLMQKGSDICLVTTGITTSEGIKACRTLKSQGIEARHIHMPTIKPMDREMILSAARETKGIVTVENHSRIGGLGSSVTEIVCDKYPVPVTRLGIDDCFGETATLDYLMEKFGITAAHIVSASLDLLGKKKSREKLAPESE